MALGVSDLVRGFCVAIYQYKPPSPTMNSLIPFLCHIYFAVLQRCLCVRRGKGQWKLQRGLMTVITLGDSDEFSNFALF